MVRVRRPSDYRPEQVPHNPNCLPLNLNSVGVVSTTVVDGPNKVFFGGIPPTLQDEEVKELLATFGPLKSFHLARDPGSVTSKGFGFCEYMDPSITPLACSGLNGLEIGDKVITVKVNPSMGIVGSVGGSSAGSVHVPAVQQKPVTRVSRSVYHDVSVCYSESPRCCGC